MCTMTLIATSDLLDSIVAETDKLSIFNRDI